MKSIAQIVCGFVALFNAVSAFADSSQGWLYWTELESDTIKRAHLDGSNVEILYSALDGVSTPGGVSLHLEMDRVYWTNASAGIWQGSLDGAQVPVPIVQERSHYVHIVIDPGNGKMYWTEGTSFSHKILKANLDGSQIEEIPVENVPGALAIDLEAGMLYWGLTNDLGCGPGKIQRANLEGAGIEDVVMGLKYVTAIAVDHDAGKIYWSEHSGCGVNAIKRRDLAGGAIETVVSESARGIAIDSAAGKMYWTLGAGVIRWANLDGTEAADLISVGLQFPIGIAVLPPSGNPADLNEDGVVNGIDLAILLGAWGACPPRGAPGSCDADLAPPPGGRGGGGGDGVVNGFDLALLLGSWS